MKAKGFAALCIVLICVISAAALAEKNSAMPPDVMEYLKGARFVMVESEAALDERIRCAAIRSDGMTAVVSRSSEIEQRHSVITLYTPEGELFRTLVLLFDGGVRGERVYFNESGKLCFFAYTLSNTVYCDRGDCAHRPLLLVELDLDTLEYVVKDTFSLLHSHYDGMFNGSVRTMNDIPVITQKGSAYSLVTVNRGLMSIENKETGQQTVVYNRLEAVQARDEKMASARGRFGFVLIATGSGMLFAIVKWLNIRNQGN